MTVVPWKVVTATGTLSRDNRVPWKVVTARSFGGTLPFSKFVNTATNEKRGVKAAMNQSLGKHGQRTPSSAALPQPSPQCELAESSCACMPLNLPSPARCQSNHHMGAASQRGCPPAVRCPLAVQVVKQVDMPPQVPVQRAQLAHLRGWAPMLLRPSRWVPCLLHITVPIYSATSLWWLPLLASSIPGPKKTWPQKDLACAPTLRRLVSWSNCGACARSIQLCECAAHVRDTGSHRHTTTCLCALQQISTQERTGLQQWKAYEGNSNSWGSAPTPPLILPPFAGRSCR